VIWLLTMSIILCTAMTGHAIGEAGRRHVGLLLGLNLMFRLRWVLVTILAVTAGCVTVDPRDTLASTSWQLVQFEGGDGTVLTPDDGTKYTLTFNADGSLAARIDCNRGSGTWKSPAPSRLELGPMALTRAMCPPESLHDRIVKHLPYVRSYVIKDGHLFLSLMADGGIYEFQPER
jgi:para-nitrobenzyl esterase